MRDGSLFRRVSSLSPLFVAGGLFLAGCDSGTTPPKPAAVPAGKGHPHTHNHAEKGPHGGALVSIGEEFAHLEVVFDAETGKITAYVLDGEAAKPVRIKADKLDLTFVLGHHHDEPEGKKDPAHKDDDDVTGSVTLSAVEPGEDGLSAVFAGTAEALKGAKEFEAILDSIKIDKAEFKNQKFNWPEGNEHEHHHH